MNFELTEDQVEIKRTARELLAARSSWEKVREHATAGEDDAKLWAELSGLGWPGIAIDEDSGGQGLGMVELCALLEELGYACAPTPFLGTVLAALAIAHAGSDEQKAAWLPKLASGEATGSLAIRDGIAPDADGADVIVVVDGDVKIVDLEQWVRGHGLRFYYHYRRSGNPGRFHFPRVLASLMSAVPT